MTKNISTLRYGNLVLPSCYLLSPLAGYTNLPFRRVVRKLGGLGLATTDLINARGLLAGSKKSVQLAETSADDKPFAVQIFGTDPGMMCDAALLLENQGVDSVDINMGCPVNRITQGGSGASMMRSTDKTIQLVQQVVEAVKEIPITVKMRLGWDATQISAPDFARAFEQVGVAAIAIHGRTREQGFKGNVSHDGIRQVVEAVETIPVIGNGDIRTVEDAQKMMQKTGCAGISIGRGALANPWIFRQLKQYEETGKYDPPGNFEERLLLLKRQFTFLVELRGFETAMVMFRPMGHWYLKHMRVKRQLRHKFQQAKTNTEFNTTLEAINFAGPCRGTRTEVLPQLEISVPSGPVERW